MNFIDMDVNYRVKGQLHRYMDTDNIGYCRGTDGRSASKLILQFPQVPRLIVPVVDGAYD